MLQAGDIRITQSRRETFERVLRSLEVHRPSKTEHDIVERIQARWHLTAPAGRPAKAVVEEWSATLDEQAVPVEEFLTLVMDGITPFVEMLLDIYRFLCRFVSTTGGRTEHFRIESNDLSTAWDFDTSLLPHQIEWIVAWRNARIQRVDADPRKVGKLLGIDNGIFYASLGSWMVVHTLIVARRDGFLSHDLREIGDEVRALLLAVIRARYLAEQSQDPAADDRWVIRAHVPAVRRALGQDGPDGWVGIDLATLADWNVGTYRIEDIFTVSTKVKPIVPEHSDEGWNFSAIAFFCALWGLGESDFRRIAIALSDPSGLLDANGLAANGARLANDLITEFRAIIRVVDTDETVKTRCREQLKVLLLPYWKDRWFLYEVWTLLYPLAAALDRGHTIELVGVSDVAGTGMEGQTWNLPTQKAKGPVARLIGPKGALDVWFQRETARQSGRGHIEPDIRLTLPQPPYPDVVILECKDRLKFARGAFRVAEDYSRESQAEEVWVVNYERPPDPHAGVQQNESGRRRFGVIEGFRPGTPADQIDRCLDAAFAKYLGSLSQPALVTNTPQFLVVDVSGSMAGKSLTAALSTHDFASLPQGHVRRWADDIEDADADVLAAIGSGRRLSGAGMESSVALDGFARGLPAESCLSVVTDRRGKETLERSAFSGRRRPKMHASRILSAGVPPRYFSWTSKSRCVTSPPRTRGRERLRRGCGPRREARRGHAPKANCATGRCCRSAANRPCSCTSRIDSKTWASSTSSRYVRLKRSMNAL